jgi:hypothetical protein
MVVENGYLNEFRAAQANLAANIAAGKGNTFAYTGAAGTSPLPIFLAHIAGYGSANCPACVTDPTKYTGSAWTQSAWISDLSAYNPDPRGLLTSATTGLRYYATYKDNMVKAGLPRNFWVANPEVNGAYISTNGPPTRRR